MGTSRLVVARGVALLLCSCLDFTGQVMTYRYDRAGDTLLIFQVYEGLHTTGVDEDPPRDLPTAEEKQQLDAVVKGQRTFFFGNWLTDHDAARNAAGIEECRAKLADADPGEQARLKTWIGLLERVNASVRVRNGGFYLNAKNQLCGYQYVVVTGVTPLVSAINACAGLKAREFDAETLGERARRRLRDFMEKGEWVRIDGNQVRIRFVCTPEEFRKHRGNLDGGDRKPVDLATQDLVLNYDEPIAEVILGRLDQEVTTLARPSVRKASGALTAHVKETYGLAPMPDLEALRAAFLRSGTVPGAK